MSHPFKSDPYFLKHRATRKRYDIRLMKGSKNGKKFETIKEKRAENIIRIGTLLEPNVKKYNQLAEILNSCTLRTPCGSAACAQCYRSYRIWFVAEAIHMVKKYKNKDARTLTILFPSEMQCNKGFSSKNDHPIDSKRIKDRLRAQLKLAGFKYPVIGCFEIDYLTEFNEWLPHFHLLVFEDDKTIEKLRRIVSGSKNQAPGKIVKGILHKRFLTDESEQVSYLCKSFSKQYVRTANGSRAKPKRLGVREANKVLVFKHRSTFSGLLFLHNCRRQGELIKSTSSSTN